MRLYIKSRNQLNLPLLNASLSRLRLKGAFLSFDEVSAYYQGDIGFETASLLLGGYAADSLSEAAGLLTNLSGKLAETLLSSALVSSPGLVSRPDEVILRDTLYGNFSLYAAFLDHFSHLKNEWIKAGLAYLDHKGEKMAAASALYLHRNSFAYRLKRLYEAGGIDVSDPHEGLLLVIYRVLNVRERQ